MQLGSWYKKLARESAALILGLGRNSCPVRAPGL